MVKLASRVKVYTLDGSFYFQDGEDLLSIDDVPDPELLRQYLSDLVNGIPHSALAPSGKDEQCKLLAELISHLSAHGLLEEEKTRVAKPPFYSWPSKKFPQRELSQQERQGLACRQVIFHGPPHPFWDELQRGLAEVEVPISRSPEPETADLVVFLKSDAAHEKAAKEFNRIAVEASQSCLYIDVHMGGTGTIGPLVIPGETGCHECFLQRRLVNGDSVTLHALKDPEVIQPGRAVFHPWQIAVIAAIACQEALRYFVEGTSISCGNVIFWDAHRLELWKEALLRFPVCPVCGDHSSRFSSSQVRLEQTLRRLQDHGNPKTEE
jgi:bacteriocin biosynthesis cyclodehydratase domain-containing protein